MNKKITTVREHRRQIPVSKKNPDGITIVDRLGRASTAEELILEYKGLLKSKTTFKETALKNFREHYAALTKK